MEPRLNKTYNLLKNASKNEVQSDIAMHSYEKDLMHYRLELILESSQKLATKMETLTTRITTVSKKEKIVLTDSW